MVALVYPASLPCPQRASYQRSERRALSDVPGQRRARTLWRDRLGTEPVQFLLTFAQVAIWLDWYENDQVQGGAWFAADWREPFGRNGVFRFIQAPSYPEFIPIVGWRVTATVEVRGRGMLPQSSTQGIDPMFADVLLLVNAENDLDDRSLYETPHMDEGSPAVSDGMTITVGKRATYTGEQLEIVAEGITVEVFSGWDELTVSPVTHSMWEMVTGGGNDFNSIVAWISDNGDWGPIATSFTTWQPAKPSGGYHHFYFFIPGGGASADVELGADGVFLESGSIGFAGPSFPGFDFVIGDYGNPSAGGTWRGRGWRITKGRRYPERAAYTVPAWPLPGGAP